MAALLGDLQRAQVFDTKKVGCLTPKTFLQHQGLKFYAPHTESWPLKHPSLDDDAQKIGVAKASFPKAPDALLESLDVRARSLVSMASHMDLFLGAAKHAIESEDSRAVASLLQSSARAAKHVMATALTMSTDIILSKRDATLALSSVLPGQGRDLLRAAPLQGHNLFGDKCAQVASADTAERQSQQLARLSLPSSSRQFVQKKKQQKQEGYKKFVAKPPSAPQAPAPNPVGQRVGGFKKPVPPPPSQQVVRSRGGAFAGRGRGRGFSGRKPRGASY